MGTSKYCQVAIFLVTKMTFWCRFYMVWNMCFFKVVKPDPVMLGVSVTAEKRVISPKEGVMEIPTLLGILSTDPGL